MTETLQDELLIRRLCDFVLRHEGEWKLLHRLPIGGALER